LVNTLHSSKDQQNSPSLTPLINAQSLFMIRLSFCRRSNMWTRWSASATTIYDGCFNSREL